MAGLNLKKWIVLVVLVNLVILWFALNLRNGMVLPVFEKYNLIPANSFNLQGFDLKNILIGFGLMLIIEAVVFYMSWLIMPGDRQWWLLVSLAASPFILRGIFAELYEQLYLLFWMLSLCNFYLGIFKKNNIYWLLASLTLAGAYLSAYNSYFLLIGLFLFLIFSSRNRYLLFTWKPYLPVAFLLMASFISIKTDFGHGFIPGSISDAGRSYEIQNINLVSLSNQISWQFILLMPVLFFALWWVALKYMIRIFDKPNQINTQVWFLLSFFLPMFLGYYVLLPFNQLHLDWLMPAYFTGIIILGKFIKLRWLKLHLISCVLFYIVAIFLF